MLRKQRINLVFRSFVFPVLPDGFGNPITKNGYRLRRLDKFWSKGYATAAYLTML